MLYANLSEYIKKKKKENPPKYKSPEFKFQTNYIIMLKLFL